VVVCGYNSPCVLSFYPNKKSQKASVRKPVKFLNEDASQLRKKETHICQSASTLSVYHHTLA
jgi:hypothetical protein